MTDSNVKIREIFQKIFEDVTIKSKTLSTHKQMIFWSRTDAIYHIPIELNFKLMLIKITMEVSF